MGYYDTNDEASRHLVVHGHCGKFQWLAPNTRVTLLADRGFDDQELYERLAMLGRDYLIRFRQNTWVPWQGERRKANERVAKSGLA